MRSKKVLSLLGAGFVALSAASADAAPKLRVQVDQRGDFVLLGNTLAHDCANGIPNPLVGTANSCGNSTSDSGADVYWRSDEPSAGQARANNTFANADARSTAMLVLPAGATVTHAYLYWAAAVGSDTADSTAVIERPGAGGFTQSLTALESFKAHATGTYPQRAYQSVANITSLVQQHGAGAYRVSGVDSAPLVNTNSETLFAGWWMTVFYSLPSDPPRNLALFDGLDPVSPGQPANATISGFLVPNAGFTGKLGVIAFEGDSAHSGDQLFFNGGTALSNGLNPSNNFFNGTRSDTLGNAISVVGDLPQLRGTAGSMSGLDLDIVDVKSKLKAGDESATIQASTSLDVFFLGGFITSISTFRPDFTTSTKTAVDVNGGALLPGDVLEYTIIVNNTGNDASVNTVLTDPLPAGVTYVPGSLRITEGANAGAKTDASGDDQGNYNAASRTVTVRIGNGANATQGGTLAVDASTTVTFRVTIDADASGTIANQATIAAAGQLGAPVTHTPTDGNGPIGGAPPTEVIVGQCEDDTHCGGSTPYCKTTSSPSVCVECKDDSHCGGATPTCDMISNACVCTPTNGGVEICDGKDNDCNGTIDEGFNVGAGCSDGLGICQAAGTIVCDFFGNSVCNAVAGTTDPVEVCGDDLDSDCDGNDNNGCGCWADDHCNVGEVCDMGAGGSFTCVEGCRGTGGNGCADSKLCTSSDASIGACVQCIADTDCGGSNNGMVCEANACVPGCRGSAGSGCQGASHCTSTDTSVGECVGCITDAHCGNSTSARVCDDGTRTCVDGCRGQAGNGCAATDVCTSADKAIGACVECTSDGHCGGAGKVCANLTKTCMDGCRGVGGNGCLGDDVCTSSNTDIGQCVECAADSDCGGPTSGTVCNQSSNTCEYGCRGTDGNTCPTDFVCTSENQGIGECVGCLKDSDCGDATSGKVCDTDTRTCGDGCRGQDGNGCPSDNVCTSTDDTVGECVGCLVDTDCGDTTSGKACDTDTRTCQDGCRGTDGNGCAGDELCTSTDDTIGACVGCLSDSDCGDVTSGIVCDDTTKSCIPGCRGAGGNGCFGNDVVCTSADTSIGQCVGCYLDIHCGGPESGKVCDTANDTCIDGCRGQDGNGCSSDNVCTSTDATVGECVGCLVDTDCGDPTSGKVCDTSARTCEDGCRGTDGNGCSGSDVCTSADDTIGACVECLSDSDCGDATSGTVCNETTNTCVTGCRGTNGNGCFGNDVVCTSTDDTIGDCVGCVEDGDCGTATSGKVCDTQTQTCVDGCRGTDGNGCSGSDICTSTDDTPGACVECLDDSDCGSGTSGKVCDSQTNACTDGCRGTNGNGCPGGDTCSSNDDTIGTCEDSGTGGAGGQGGEGGSGGAGGDDTDAGAGGDDFGADDSDVWATGNGLVCSAQPGVAGQAAGWLLGGAVVAMALARRRRR